MRRALPILVILLVGVGAATWYGGPFGRRRDDAIRGSGMIEVTQVDVAFEVAGRVIERTADEGKLIDKGEPVARLDEREYRLQVERATATKAAADARYRLLLSGARAQEIDTALAAVEAADSDRSMQRAEQRRIAALQRNGLVSNADLDRANTALANADSVYQQARLHLDLLKEGARTEEIEEARARLHEAEKALELAELELARCQLFAPVAG